MIFLSGIFFRAVSIIALWATVGGSNAPQYTPTIVDLLLVKRKYTKTPININMITAFFCKLFMNIEVKVNQKRFSLAS